MIHVRDLTKSYADLARGKFVAVEGVSFSAIPGQIYGLLGPNGAGKTTILRILSTVLRPSGGSANVNGYDVLTQPSLVRRQIGFVSANTAVYDRMTASEMVEYFGRLHGLTGDRLAARMEDVFGRLQMNEMRDVLGAKMSTGMKQKVSIARALVHDPPVLIFDEATAGLDVLAARSLLNAVAELRTQGKCIVFSTHIMREAERLCDRVAVMHRGRMLAAGSLAELAEQHGETDLEELFFNLISRHEALAGESERPRMKWQSVRLIFMRELRDQLRDRRTLFTIVVLPLVLYPLLGMSFIQITQFRRDHDSKILLLGARALPGDPGLLKSATEGEAAFLDELCPAQEAQSLSLHVASDEEAAQLLQGGSGKEEIGKPDDRWRDVAQAEIRSGRYDAVIYFPSGFAEELTRFNEQLDSPLFPSRGEGPTDPSPQPSPQRGEGASPAKPPQPTIYVNMASEKSRMAEQRVDRVLSRWRQSIVRRNLEDRHVPAAATEPFQIASSDVAEANSLRAATWSKVLPFVVLIWALTGAFYPAIDLCAGEKERGTLETLLSSPAERSEIVFGKLFTVITFSMATALLNLASMGLTGAFIIGQLAQIDPATQLHLGPPPVLAMFWLALALPLASGLFGALSLAIAAFARSSKEGQYYLMPLLLITLPLMMLSMLPGAELDLGTSLVPVTGMLLLLRTLIEGHYLEAARYALPVVGVTAACCGLSVRWAVNQFRNESVLFRESERFRLGLWLRHVVRDRGDTPRVSDAILCGVLLLMLRFFVGMVASPPQTWFGFGSQTVVVLAALIATPALLMAIMLTRRPWKTLLIKAPHPAAVPAAIALALLLHPAAMCLAQTVTSLYPMSDEVTSQLSRFTGFINDAPSIWALLAVMALAPALCEELAFRGFILSGLRHMGHKWAAIVLSSVFFGAAHGILQQSLTACVVGVVLGFLAVQTGSLLPSILFHFTYNAATIWISVALPKHYQESPFMEWIFRRTGEEYVYRWPVVIGGAALAVAILYWFRRLPHQSSAEETLHEALDHPVLDRQAPGPQATPAPSRI